MTNLMAWIHFVTRCLKLYSGYYEKNNSYIFCLPEEMKIEPSEINNDNDNAKKLRNELFELLIPNLNYSRTFLKYMKLCN